MGQKSKAAITTANSSIEKMTGRLSDVLQNFMGYQAQKKGKKESITALAKYCQNKYPGQTDVSQHYDTDPTLKDINKGIERARTQSKDFKEKCKIALVILDQEIKAGKEALNTLDRLIVAKSKERSDAKGLKKIGAALKSKSLKDLKNVKAKLDKTFETVARETIGIRAFYEKISK